MLCVSVWGTYGSFPVLYSGLVTAFGSGPNAPDAHLALKLSFISSLNYAVSSVCGLVTGPICDLVGVRLLAAAALLFGEPLLYMYTTALSSTVNCHSFSSSSLCASFVIADTHYSSVYINILQLRKSSLLNAIINSI